MSRGVKVFKCTVILTRPVVEELTLQNNDLTTRNGWNQLWPRLGNEESELVINFHPLSTELCLRPAPKTTG